MPTVTKVGGYRLFFYSNEGDEPPHVHVEQGTCTAKFWIRPVRLARSQGFRPHRIRSIEAIVEGLESHIEEAWNDHFRR